MAFESGVVFRVLCLILVAIKTTRSQQALPEDLQGNPCSHPRSIKLPTSNKCLVIVKESKDWTNAEATCQRVGGSLYKMPSALLYTRPRLMDCLSSYNGSDLADLWLNGVSLWFPHFFWANKNATVLNKVKYCPNFHDIPNFKGTPITSDYLSVDYCVFTCYNNVPSAKYTVLYSTGTSPKCNCLQSLEPQYRVPCDSQAYNYNDKSKMYIVQQNENSMIKIGSADTFSSTEIMCATVDSKTLADGAMRSDTCFTERPFLCQLGTAAECREAREELRCQSLECFFPCAGKCLKRVSLNYNWYAAKSYCANLGGDLWDMKELKDMQEVIPHLDTLSRYWVGASNYAWNFNATSHALDNIDMNKTKVRCGHMIRKVTSGVYGRTWTWSDAQCQHKKSFLCQFDDYQFTSDQVGQSVVCPWPIIVKPATPITLSPITLPIVVTETHVTVHDSSFPIAAVIAGIIAALLLLTCLGLLLGFCGRRHWGKVRERLTFIPYFGGNRHVAMGNSHEFENMSHGRGHMTSVSEHGSQIGLVKGGFSSYETHTESNGMFSSKSMDRRHFDSMGQKLADSQNYLANANDSMDERGFGATYATMPSKQKGFMTLQAHMTIQDDAQLAAMRGSLRRKPEMSLVTDHSDMNLTINHANTMNGGTALGNVGNGGGGIAEHEFIIDTGSASNGHAFVIGNGNGGGNIGGEGIVIEDVVLPAVASKGGEQEFIIKRGSGNIGGEGIVIEDVVLPAAASRGGGNAFIVESGNGNFSRNGIVIEDFTLPAAASRGGGNAFIVESGNVSHRPVVIVGNGNGNTGGSGIVIEDFTLPAATSEGGVILTFPERVQGAHTHTYSVSPTVQVQQQQHHLSVV